MPDWQRNSEEMLTVGWKDEALFYGRGQGGYSCQLRFQRTDEELYILKFQ